MNQTQTTDISNKSVLSPRLSRNFWLFMLGLFIVATLAFYLIVTSRYAVSVDDFFIEWKGAQIAVNGGDPYSDAATLEIQHGLYRFNVPPDQDQLAFVYPYWRIFYNLPIVFLPYDWAAAIWVGLLITLFLGSVYLITQVVGWRPKSALQQSVLYLSLLLSFPVFGSLMLGQVALLDGSLLALIFFCLRTGRQGWAGFLLALITVKPQLAVVMVGLLVLRALWKREWRFLLSFAITMAILAGASFAVYPSWFSKFLAGISRYPSYKPTLTGPSFIFGGLGSVGTVLAALIWLVIAIAGLIIWWRELRGANPNTTLAIPPGTAFDFSYCAGLIMTLLLPPQTNIVNAVLLEVPIILLMVRWSNRKQFKLFYLMAACNIILSWTLYISLFNNFYGWLIVGPVSIVTLVLILNFRQELGAIIQPSKQQKDLNHVV